MVLLIGNYPADQQQSMQRFAQMMLHGLTTAGVAVEFFVSATPRAKTFRRCQRRSHLRSFECHVHQARAEQAGGRDLS